MSAVFHITDKKKMFSQAPVLTVKECLDLIEGLSQFSFDETDEDFSLENFYASPLSRFECLLVGIDGQSGRGFEISYEKEENAYQVRINTPATRADWRLALSFMQTLAQNLDSPIRKEDGVCFTAENIMELDYEHDIAYGIKAFCQKALESGSAIIFGVFRPIYIDRALAQELLTSPDRLSRFDELVHRTQYTDAYAAHQQFYRNKEDDSIIGNYALTEGLPTILPYQPYVEYDNLSMLGEREVSCWQITFVCCENENDPESYYALGQMEYDSFIRKLDRERYSFLDGGYIVTAGLSKEEMMKLLE